VHIVDRKTFLALPNGIVYSHYKSLGMIEGLCQKTETWTHDWIYQDLIDSVESKDSGEFVDIMFAAEKGGSFKMDLNCEERDGSFDELERFAIYNKEDLEQLVAELAEVLKNYPTGE
jgi:hypothetical protein